MILLLEIKYAGREDQVSVEYPWGNIRNVVIHIWISEVES